MANKVIISPSFKNRIEVEKVKIETIYEWLGQYNLTQTDKAVK